MGFEEPAVTVPGIDPHGWSETAPASGGSAAALSGTVLRGRYRLGELIGYGGSADVYAGTDELLGRPVAVKVFKAHLTDPVNLARQRSEMRLLAGLDHRHLVTIHDAWLPDDATAVPVSPNPSVDRSPTPTYLVMELVSGRSLANLLAQGALPEPEVRGMAIGMAEALSLIHSRGLVHRDIKPANILFTATGVAKLSDFGIARMVDAAHLTATQDVIGTAAYLSPEQATGGPVDSATDVYALGLVLLESLTGRREFPGPPLESALTRLRRDPWIPPTLPDMWPATLTAMTMADPSARPTAAEVLDVLRGAFDGGERPAPMGQVPLRKSAISGTPIKSSYEPTLIEHPHAAATTGTAPTILWTPAIDGRPRTRNRWIGGIAASILAVLAMLFTYSSNRDAGTNTPTDPATTSPASDLNNATTDAPEAASDPPSASALPSAEATLSTVNTATAAQLPPVTISAPVVTETTTTQLPPVTTAAPAVTQTVTSSATVPGNGKGTKPSDNGKPKSTKTKPPKSK